MQYMLYFGWMDTSHTHGDRQEERNLTDGERRGKWSHRGRQIWTPFIQRKGDIDIIHTGGDRHRHSSNTGRDMLIILTVGHGETWASFTERKI